MTSVHPHDPVGLELPPLGPNCWDRTRSVAIRAPTRSDRARIAVAGSELLASDPKCCHQSTHTIPSGLNCGHWVRIDGSGPEVLPSEHPHRPIGLELPPLGPNCWHRTRSVAIRAPTRSHRAWMAATGSELLVSVPKCCHQSTHTVPSGLNCRHWVELLASDPKCCHHSAHTSPSRLNWCHWV